LPDFFKIYFKEFVFGFNDGGIFHVKNILNIYSILKFIVGKSKLNGK